MKTAFWLGFLLGFGGVLAGAHFLPWVAHDRLPSQTSVVANGGRAEQFLIRLPADRIAATGSPGATCGDARCRGRIASGRACEGAAARRALQGSRHLRQRDRGRGTPLERQRRAAGTAWSVLIPSRGGLLLTAPGEARAALDAALQKGRL